MIANESDFSGVTWSKSSYSASNNGQCVEVASVRGGVGVRDSKQHGAGPMLTFTATEWTAFLAGARTQSR